MPGGSCPQKVQGDEAKRRLSHRRAQVLCFTNGEDGGGEVPTYPDGPGSLGAVSVSCLLLLSLFLIIRFPGVPRARQLQLIPNRTHFPASFFRHNCVRRLPSAQVRDLSHLLSCGHSTETKTSNLTLIINTTAKRPLVGVRHGPGRALDD